ncbi:MAG: DNA translocase FtsK 4TM domain-containing protein [Gemmatimonadetes bacterium]|nr:DNA translocase FtsK 4TM domain-containing protein [Gemmatimonadota bacterium]MYA41986.1 DNA translocase FtsK [Gemmatimonadota bacterium]MYE94903.1 DNA translocase FtsK [Gemmatimonadota bacterium]MYJ11755.1 DNA translocase FtsK [Gemmatimonadota bacterium]
MRQRRAVAAITAVLAFLVAAAIFPLRLLGERAAGVFRSGNPVGEVGSFIDEQLVAALGLGSGAVPLALLAAAATTGNWWPAPRRKSLWIVTASVLVLVPVSAFLAGADGLATGFVGTVIGGALYDAIGPVGAWVLVGAAVVATSLAAFRFNPLAPPAAVVARTYRGTNRGVRALAAAGGRWRSRKRERRRAKRAEMGAQKTARLPGTSADEGTDAVAGTVSEPESEVPEPAVSMAQPAGPDLLRDDELPSVDYPLPGLELLTAPRHESRLGMERELDGLGEVLTRTLETFNIKSRIAGRTTGPAVTQYEVVPAPGIKVNRIANLDADLALAMKAKSVRIVAPIPGKGAVGVEIPNPQPEMVRLREILDAPVFARSRGLLPLALGKDLTGNPFVADLAGMPHALIAGATGSGKSVCLNTIITSLVYRHGPDRLRFLLIDPKMVELSAYADLPHLRHPVVTDPREAAGALKWAVLEMDRRYGLLSANGVRSLHEFNERLEGGAEMKLAVPDGPEEEEDSWIYDGGPLPWIVVVVDELADLMMTVQAEVEKPLTQLAQKARAIGIHLLVATQRPSVNVITGLIKANFPCRVAFRVASKTDSRTILDQNGADSLLGSGDMLFLPPAKSEPVRMQGAFISTGETEALMGWYREQADTLEALKARVRSDEADILDAVKAAESEDDAGSDGAIRGDWDPLFREAAGACIQQGAGSTSLLQRRLRIGYGRAARIVDQLHDAGVLGPPDGSKPRDVLVGQAGLDEICPS